MKKTYSILGMILLSVAIGCGGVKKAVDKGTTTGGGGATAGSANTETSTLNLKSTGYVPSEGNKVAVKVSADFSATKESKPVELKALFSSNDPKLNLEFVTDDKSASALSLTAKDQKSGVFATTEAASITVDPASPLVVQLSNASTLNPGYMTDHPIEFPAATYLVASDAVASSPNVPAKADLMTALTVSKSAAQAVNVWASNNHSTDANVIKPSTTKCFITGKINNVETKLWEIKDKKLTAAAPGVKDLAVGAQMAGASVTCNGTYAAVTTSGKKQVVVNATTQVDQQITVTIAQ